MTEKPTREQIEKLLEDIKDQPASAFVEAIEVQEVRRLCVAALRDLDAEPRIGELEKLVDRANKMMQMAGYQIAEHNPEHNNPIIAWMADARAALAKGKTALNPKAAWPFPEAKGKP